MSELNHNKILNEKNKVISLVNNSKTIIRLLAGIVAVLFGWLKFRGLPIDSIINEISTELILKLAIIIYYFSWLFGTTLDASDQGIVFHKAIDKGKIPALGVFLAIIITGFLIALCFMFDTPIFSFLFLLFWFCNYIMWSLFISNIMHPYFTSNKTFYKDQGDYLNLKRFEIVESFLYGSWNKKRFFIGFLLLIPATIISSTKWLDFIFTNSDKKHFYVSILIMVFVLTVELWVWFYRLKRKFSLTTLTEVIEEQPEILKQE
jgi:hypothetical protein